MWPYTCDLLTWCGLFCRSPDGQTLILAARDGYCTLVMFDDILPAHHTQQHAMQMQAIAHNNYVPLTYALGATPAHGHAHAPNQGQGMPHAMGSQAHAHAQNQTPTHSQTSTHIQTAQNQSQTPVQPAPPNAKKRAEPPLTPAASVDGSEAGVSVFGAAQAAAIASSSSSSVSAAADGAAGAPGESSARVQEPPKKKRRVALTRIGDLEP